MHSASGLIIVTFQLRVCGVHFPYTERERESERAPLTPVKVMFLEHDFITYFCASFLCAQVTACWSGSLSRVYGTKF